MAGGREYWVEVPVVYVMSDALVRGTSTRSVTQDMVLCGTGRVRTVMVETGGVGQGTRWRRRSRRDGIGRVSGSTSSSTPLSWSKVTLHFSWMKHSLWAGPGGE